MDPHSSRPKMNQSSWVRQHRSFVEIGSGLDQVVGEATWLRTEAFAVDTVLFGFISQDTFSGVEQLGRTLAISPGGFKRILDQIALISAHGVVERESRERARLLCCLQSGRKMMAVNYSSLANQHRALDDIFQLANVTRPVIAGQHIDS